MQITLHRVAHQVNADPTLYVGHPLSTRSLTRAGQLKVSDALLRVREPLEAFGYDVLAYYRTPEGATGAYQMASGDRLLKSIAATTAQFASLNNLSSGDPRRNWTRGRVRAVSVPRGPAELRMSERLAILDMPGPRLMMMSMLMATTLYSRKLIRLMAFEQPYIQFRTSSRAHRVFGWVLPALEEAGVDLERFFCDMATLNPERPYHSERVLTCNISSNETS
jgi:hypothetical protein